MFHLPAGFEIQLVAAEPDINKPMNLAFDAKGRLWVTTSIEYPYAAPTNRPARDRLMILDDFGPDGRARRVTQFADDLNIPIGIYPFFSPASPATSNASAIDPSKRDSMRATNQANASTNPGTWKCIVWSIPNIWLFEDTDGDGKANKREVLYGPFDCTRDTHGNQASFRRGFDGWLYCTHGYNNDSHVKGRDGHQVDLNSGNTYRIRLDGSRIEHYTHGQVNPFGLAFDPQGNLFSSDCHSAPIYQLLAGGYYPSFGKPDDGLGFAPTMMSKPRGSTALDGISYYGDDLWPEEFRDNIFIGDVMTSRVYRDKAVEKGATKIADSLPDFVATDDPWFRPVDTQLGPDGALYIADFYNRIIGHYEVPLTHPGRDRTSGRIWRVVNSKASISPALSSVPTAIATNDTSVQLWPPFDFSKASLSELLTALGHPNLTRRILAMNTIADRFGVDALSAVRNAVHPLARKDFQGQLTEAEALQWAHALWLVYRLDSLRCVDEAWEASQSGNALVRAHAMRVFTARGFKEFDGTSPRRSFGERVLREEVIKKLNDPNALVQRCAAEALGAWPSFDQIRPLLALRERVPDKDTHLLYVARKALRDQLVPEENFRRFMATNLITPDQITAIADVAIAVKTAEAATFLLRELPRLVQAPNASPSIADVLKHVARYAPESELTQLASFANGRIPPAYGREQYQEIERQFSLFKSVDEGLQQRGHSRPEAVRAWGTNLVWKFFAALDSYHSWMAVPYETNPTEVPWDLETRTSTDGKKRQLTSSFPHGEDLTGVLRSPDFPLPTKLTFWLCGHDGFPDKPAGNLNFVRLRLHDSGQILATAPAPRNDAARRVTWEFPQHAGQRAFVEAVDGDDGRAYAWIAFGDFAPELPQLRPSEFSPRKMLDWIAGATDAAIRLQMKESAPVFAHFLSPQRNLSHDSSGAETFASLARAWVALEPAQAIPVLASALTTNYGPIAYREAVAGVLAGQNTSAAQAAVLAAAKSLPLTTQEKIALTLASAKFSAETLLAGLESGAISPRVLYRNSVNTRLKNSKPTDWEARLRKLTVRLPPPDDARNKLIADRRAAYSTAPGHSDVGKLVFTKQCAACHKIGNEGALIGPQLDGIGARGLERLCEDVLDPNRNVDRAFRTTLLTLKDGDIVSGLFRREEGEVIVLADSTGKELSIPKGTIMERHESDVSLMPENFGDLLSQEDFSNLMAFLLGKDARGR
jgi:putative heme-binding domain-containing protein